MRVDVLALQRFYASPLGEAAQRAAARRLMSLWPHADGLDVLGVGYPLPYLDRFRAGARRVVTMMPAAQGAEPWPAGERVATALSDEARLPFVDAVFDRVLMVHGLEECDAVPAMLREIWRVMAPEGRLVVIAANRWSLWAQSDISPFGHGRPYSRTQLASLLGDSMFEPVVSARALYLPPWRWAAGVADAFERVGELVWPAQGGLVLMEAVKRLYATTARSEGRVLLAKAPKRSQPEPNGALPENKRDS
ncbi:MAG: methyltransferase domain-containing protein [Hyphomonadaceae bacterium]